MKKLFSYTLGGVLLAASMGASAGFVLDSGGSSFTLNSGGNFDPNGSGSSYAGQTGTIGADLSWAGVVQPTSWTFEYLGKEASYNNVFQFTDGTGGWENVFSTGNSSPGASGSSSVQDFAFRFLSNNNSGNSVTNSTNQIGSPSFWAQVSGDGNSVVLWFADAGAGDRDFDDMGVRIAANVSSVPIPAALPLFLSALAGLGFIGFRRRNA